MEKSVRPFTSALTKREAAAVLVYFPLHIMLLPLLLYWVLGDTVTESMINLIYYAVGAVYMLIFCWGLLRRDFDIICERPLRVLIVVFASYALILCFNFVFALIMLIFPDVINPNNQAIADNATEDFGPMAAAATFLAPIVEELLFRAGLFGLIRRRNRVLAYVVSMLLFAAYHIWGYIAIDPIYLIYLLQYLPAAWALCYCYERTNSVWGSIFLHMLVNGVAMNAASLLA